MELSGCRRHKLLNFLHFLYNVPDTDNNLHQLCRFISGADKSEPSPAWAGQPEQIAKLVELHGLGGALFQRLSPVAEDMRNIRSRLRDKIVDDAKLSLLREADILALTQHLADIHAPCLLIKGAALAYLYYPSPSLRPRADTDIVIDHQSVIRIHESLRSRGYQCQPLVTPLDRGQYLTTQFLCNRSDGRGTHFDIHWKINNSTALGRLLTFEELIAQSISIPAFNGKIKAPGPGHALIISCLHWIGEPNKRLIWLYDIHLLNDNLTVNDWARIVRFAADKKCAGLILSVLNRVAYWFDTPFPAGATAGLERIVAENPNEWGNLLTTKPESHLRSRYVDLKILGWRERMSLLSTLCFPPGTYLALQDPRLQHASAASLFLAYAARPFKSLFPRRV